MVPGRHCWPAEGRSQVPTAWKRKKTQSPRHLGGVRCFRWLDWRLGRRFRSADERRHRSLLQRCCLRDQRSLLNRRSFLATEPPSHVVLEPLKSFTNVIQQDPSAVPSSLQRSNLSRNNGVVGGWVSPEDKCDHSWHESAVVLNSCGWNHCCWWWSRVCSMLTGRLLRDTKR